jgi:hypothetical protein
MRGHFQLRGADTPKRREKLATTEWRFEEDTFGSTLETVTDQQW